MLLETRFALEELFVVGTWCSGFRFDVCSWLLFVAYRNVEDRLTVSIRRHFGTMLLLYFAVWKLATWKVSAPVLLLMVLSLSASWCLGSDRHFFSLLTADFTIYCSMCVM